MEKQYIPKYLNAEPQILWWDLSDFLILMVFLAIGILADQQLYGFLTGVVALKVIGVLQTEKPLGFLKHYFYSIGLWGMKGRVPEYWIKELGR